jgi:hypothetical protein
MFVDQNLTKTKAYQEQLDQHGELYAAWKGNPPKLREKKLEGVRKGLTSVGDWLGSFIRPEARVGSNNSP